MALLVASFFSYPTQQAGCETTLQNSLSASLFSAWKFQDETSQRLKPKTQPSLKPLNTKGLTRQLSLHQRYWKGAMKSAHTDLIVPL